MCKCSNFTEYMQNHATVCYRRAISNSLGAAIIERIECAAKLMNWYCTGELRSRLPNNILATRVNELLGYCKLARPELYKRCREYTQAGMRPLSNATHKHARYDSVPENLKQSTRTHADDIEWTLTQLMDNLTPLACIKHHANPRSVAPANLVQMLYRLAHSCKEVVDAAGTYYRDMSSLGRYVHEPAGLYAQYISRASNALHKTRYSDRTVPDRGIKRKHPTNMKTPAAKRPCIEIAAPVPVCPAPAPAPAEIRRIATRSTTAEIHPVSARTRSQSSQAR